MITVLFSCPACKLRDATATVRAREETEDVREWMGVTVARALEFAHMVESPRCRHRMLQDVKIPLPKDDDQAWIGKQTDQVPPKGK